VCGVLRLEWLECRTTRRELGAVRVAGDRRVVVDRRVFDERDFEERDFEERDLVLRPLWVREPLLREADNTLPGLASASG
jgi:hypothetical protein